VAELAAGCNDLLTKPVTVSLEWLNNKIIEWGSIKALQMFTDSLPDFVKSVSAGQAVQAQNIAAHMPEGWIISPQPVVPGVSPQQVQDQHSLARLDNFTPSLVYKSFSPIQVVLNGSLELNRGRSGKLILI
jgi:hypothetical protein